MTSTLALPFSYNYMQKNRIGVMANLFRASGYLHPQLANMPAYQCSAAAELALGRGEIDILITSPHYLLKDYPQFAVFGSIPMDLNPDLKNQWIKKNYFSIEKHYKEKGFASDYMGLLSALNCRLSSCTNEDFENWQSRKTPIVIAANGQRRLWFDHLGFNTLQGKYLDRLSYQFELMQKNKLEISDSASPGLIEECIKHNEKYNLVKNEFYNQKNLIIDSQSKSVIPIEIIYRKKLSEKLVKNLKIEVAQIIATDVEYQAQAFDRLVSNHKLNVYDGLPKNLSQKLLRYKETYLNLLSEYSVEAHSINCSYRKEQII